MPTIFAIDGAEDFDFGDFGAYSSGVASLQTALIALGQKVGDSTLSALVLDGLIGPKTTAAANRAFTNYISNAPNFASGGAMSQSQVASAAEELASFVKSEVARRSGGSSSPAATAVRAPSAAAVVAPAVSDTSAQIVKYAAIGLGGVVVASLLYYMWRRSQGRPVFGGFGEVSLHERIAKALGWPLRDVESMSLPSLRELVRPVDRHLAEEISESINYHQDLTRRSREKPFRVGRRSGFGGYYEEEERAARNAQILAKDKSRHAEIGDREFERGKIGKAAAWSRHQGAIRALMELRQKALAAHDNGAAREADMLIRWHKNVIETRYRPGKR